MFTDTRENSSNEVENSTQTLDIVSSEPLKERVDHYEIDHILITFTLLGPFLTAIILSSNPIVYFLGAIILSVLLYGVSRFIGFFVKRNSDYYNSVDYNEEDE